MNIWQRFKAAFSRQNFLVASRSPWSMEQGLGLTHGGFDATAALRQFSSWVYAASMLNAQAVAAVPLRLYARRRPGRKLFATHAPSRTRQRYLAGDDPQGARPSQAVLTRAADWGDDYEVVTEPHPALELLETVNPHFNGFELTMLRLLYLQLTGDAYLHVVQDPLLGRPSELWPMPSQWTRVIPDDRQFVAGYRYGADPFAPVEFGADEVIHFRLPNPEHLHHGKSKLEAVWSALGLHQSKRAMDQARFDNHARPDFLLIVRQGASAEALDRFEKQIDSRLRGVRRSGRFITITGDVQAQPLSFPPEVLGDPERVLEEIAAGFGVPISKLLSNHPNRANADAADRAWLRDTVLPLCRLDEQKLNERYLPLFGIAEDAFLAYDNPVPEDQHFALKRRVELVGAGILSIDEARAEEGLPPASHVAG